jgi:hypothetical protein
MGCGTQRGEPAFWPCEPARSTQRPRGSGWGRRGVRGRFVECSNFWDATSFGDGYDIRDCHAPDDTPPLDPGEEPLHRNPSTVLSVSGRRKREGRAQP